MKEHFVVTGINGEGSFEINFDSEEEALYVYEILRSGFISEEERESSRKWVQIPENRQELDNAFANAWVMIKIARYMEDDEFNKVIKDESSLLEEFSKMAIEVAKLISILVDAAGKTKEKGAISTKKVRKRLAPVLKRLEDCAGKDFIKRSITFPTIKITD